MITTGDITRDAAIAAAVYSSRQSPVAEVQYYDGSQWITFEDVVSFSFNRTNRKTEPGAFSRVPPAKTFSFTLDNSRLQYNAVGGGEFAGVLRRGLKVRARAGYRTGVTRDDSRAVSASSYKTLYHTQVSGSAIVPDITSEPTTYTIAGLTDGLVYYGSTNYGGATYSAEGFYLSKVFDFDVYKSETINRIQMTSATDGVFLYTRESASATYIDNVSFAIQGELSAGTNDYIVDDSQERYFQFAIVFATGDWSTGSVSDIIIEYETDAELFPRGTFVIDSVSYSSGYQSKQVSVSCRDELAKAIQSKISTTDYTGVDIADVVRDIADDAGIPHNDGVTEYIEDTTLTVTADAFAAATAIDALDECMLYINGLNEDWRLYVNNDGYLTLTQQSTSLTTFDIAFSYRESIESLSRSITVDDVIKRATVYSESPSSKSEKTLLASQTYTSAGVKTLSWANAATDKTYSFVYGNDTTSITSFVWDDDGLGCEFTVAGTPIDLSISIYGNVVTTSGFLGESVSVDFYQDNIGYDYEFVNRFVSSNINATTIAENIINLFSSNFANASASISINADPRLELSDKALIFESNTITNELFLIDAISESFTAQGAAYKQSITLRTLGAVLDDLIYDRDEITGNGDINYDSGFIYDADILSIGEDTSTYPTKNYVN